MTGEQSDVGVACKGAPRDLGFDQGTYLRIVEYHARQIGLWGELPSEEFNARALRFALERASRSGRTARHACVTIRQELESKLR